MPAKSRDQQQAASLALKAKRGKIKKKQLTASAQRMFENMNEKQLRDFASTRRKSLPQRKGK